MNKIDLKKELEDYIDLKEAVTEITKHFIELNKFKTENSNTQVIPLINPTSETVARAKKMIEDKNRDGLMKLLEIEENKMFTALGKASLAKELEETLLSDLCYAIMSGEVEPEEPVNIETIETFCGQDYTHPGKVHYAYKIEYLDAHSGKNTLLIDRKMRVAPIQK